MPVKVRVPTPLRRFTGGIDEVAAAGESVRAVIEDLEKRHPGMRERLLDDKGELRRFVNIYLNGDDIRFLNQLNSQVKDGDDISIVPAIAGGE
ncbi:MAG: ubiquitin-like small modifier protein 1 [Candidatus Binataceae bacterium]|jgi:molybdopterin synthase sulfur carrier subunit|nr:ubiquitin-like small modifier protein 1 [Candidatus Binataceae bacterium]